jgi:hypothetical protein
MDSGYAALSMALDRIVVLEAELAEARKEAANLIRQTTPMPISLDPYERGKFDGRMYAVEQLEG